jgi:hypothetical protein
MKGWPLTAAAIVVLLSAELAHASIITDPVPDDLTIIHDNLRWVWASPVACESYSVFNHLRPPEFHPGWRYATDEEWASRPAVEEFLRIPGDVTSVRHAVQYWNTWCTDVDYWDAWRGFVTSRHRYNSAWETWYVSDLPAPTVPEPSALVVWLLLGCLALTANWRSRKSR